MEKMIEELAMMQSPFFKRINSNLERSRQLRSDLQDLLRDVRRATREPRSNDAMPSAV